MRKDGAERGEVSKLRSEELRCSRGLCVLDLETQICMGSRFTHTGAGLLQSTTNPRLQSIANFESSSNKSRHNRTLTNHLRIPTIVPRPLHNPNHGQYSSFNLRLHYAATKPTETFNLTIFLHRCHATTRRQALVGRHLRSQQSLHHPSRLQKRLPPQSKRFRDIRPTT